MPFDPSAIGDDVDAYFASVEARHDDIIPGTEKRVIWADGAGVRTEWVVLNIHGFSATSEEIRPVPDNVAKGLGANLVFTRLAGHGRGPHAMSEATSHAWLDDFAEAMEAARRVGDKIIVITTSTGGTIAAACAQDPDVMAGAVGIVFVSPNFGLAHPLRFLLDLPGARAWLPWVAGRWRNFEPHNDQHAAFWTIKYESIAALPMAQLVRRVQHMDHAQSQVPALFFYAETDQVVSASWTAKVASAWGGSVETAHPSPGPQDDPNHHVIAGDILSPSQTAPAVERVLGWARRLP